MQSPRRATRGCKRNATSRPPRSVGRLVARQTRSGSRPGSSTSQTNPIQRSRARSSERTIRFRAVRIGKASATRPSGLTGPSGTTVVGGEAVTTASDSSVGDIITGTTGSGIRPGATIPATRIIRMTGRSTAITICRPIRWLPTCRRRCKSRDIITAKWTVCLGRSRARQSPITSATGVYISPRRSMNQRSPRWG